MRTPALLAGGGLALTVAAIIFLSVVNSYSSQTCGLNEEGNRSCSSSSRTLVEEQGAGVIALFLIPLALSSAGLLATLEGFQVSSTVRWIVSGLFLLLCLITGFSTGLFFLPAALLLLISTFLDSREASSD